MSIPGTQAIDRAADLVVRVVQSPDPLSTLDLAAVSGLARSTAARLLAALERAHLVARDVEGRGYLPGPLFEQYAARTDTREWIARQAQPHMDALSERTGETINLAVPVGASVVQIAQVDSTYMLGSRDWMGVDLPAHCSSLGKTLYAFGAMDLPAALEVLTEHTVTDVDRLTREFATIRERGYATTVDELEVGLTGIGAPVRLRGRLVAALGLSGPSTRLSHRLDELGPLVAEHAERLSAHTDHDLSSPDTMEGAS